jgi:hypothetical protein
LPTRRRPPIRTAPGCTNWATSRSSSAASRKMIPHVPAAAFCFVLLSLLKVSTPCVLAAFSPTSPCPFRSSP